MLTSEVIICIRINSAKGENCITVLCGITTAPGELITAHLGKIPGGFTILTVGHRSRPFRFGIRACYRIVFMPAIYIADGLPGAVLCSTQIISLISLIVLPLT